MNRSLRQKILSTPHSPGVYLFKNSKNRIIYIGKAADLNKRLVSYLTKEDNRQKILLSSSFNIDIIITNSDTEALALEESLIKLNKPRFNVRLKDDKKFPYLKITIKETFPRVLFTRDIKPDGSLIFGPYTNARALRQTRDALCRIFKLVSCTKDLSKKKTRPCLEFNLGRCSAPCSGNIGKEKYQVFVEKAVKFLRGNSNELENEVEKAMWQCAEKENFEGAALLRDQVLAIRRISQRQHIVANSAIVRDIIGMSKSRSVCIACLFRIREGRLIAKEIFDIKITPGTDDAEIASSFIRLIYTHVSFIPEEIVISPLPIEWETQHRWFKERGFSVKISTGRRGETKQLLSWAQKNAASELAKRVFKRRVHPAILELQDILHLSRPPRWIEAFDISNLKEKFAVGGSVAFYDGRPSKQRYRRYRIKRTSGQNDFVMIHEIVSRRVKDLKKERKKPDLLLIDGGKGQLNAAIDAIKSIDIDIPVFALAKRNEELFDQDGLVITLSATSKGLILLKRIRDEAHRFAIMYHRKIRRKTFTTSILDRIYGIGKKRKITLLTYYGSIEMMQKASEEDLAKVPGIGEKFAKIIYEAMHH
jgi:excinuclease ABC subunit C